MPGVDRAGFAAAFVTRLRRAGVPVGLTAAESFVGGLGVCQPATRGELYWLARITLVRQPSDLERFDAVFDAVFSGTGTGLDPPARRQPLPPEGSKKAKAGPAAGAPSVPGAWPGLPWATRQGALSTEGEAGDEDRSLHDVLPSALAIRPHQPFSCLDEGELAALDAWLLRAMRAWPSRRSRRRRTHPRGTAVAVRPTLARARRHGFEPLGLVRVRAVPRRRRVVMLCDVSQSMQPFAAAYLHLLRAAAVGADAEVFVFATSLTRLTPVLARSSADVAVRRATEAVGDRFGGTRIASSIAALLGSRHGDTLRGAIVVVASDGWDSDSPDDLRRQMGRLARRAYRVIWLNPRLASPGYAPLAGGMAAALPFCDHVLPADTIAAMAEVVDAMAGA
jgi:uncharacterized protein with von Willebrand factor type A (vWA) domain